MTEQTPTPDLKPTVGGQPVEIGQFSAYKAVLAMEIVSEVEAAFRQVLAAGAKFKQDYIAANFMTMTRAEAKRQYGPQPLITIEATEDGQRMEPVVDEDGLPILGPDPLAHLTEADWEHSGQQLRIPEYPTEQMVTMSMIPVAFKLAREQMFNLIALAITPNRQLETWDEAGTVETELATEAKKLIHRCTAAEPIDLFVAAMITAKDELAVPLGRAQTSMRALFEQEKETQTAPTVQAMSIVPDAESDGSESLPTSSTASADATAGTPESSSTDKAGVV